MSKELALRIIKLLSSLETAGMMADKKLPDVLRDEIDDVVCELSEELLK